VTWSHKKPQGRETAKTRWRAQPYLRGRGLDLGCGPEKILDTEHCIGVDSNKDLQLFGIAAKFDLKADVEKLPMFADSGFDWVYSSHVLEHIQYEKVPAVLREWFRLIRIGGHLVLYLPDEDQYPKCFDPLRGVLISEPHCNTDHRWNCSYERVVEAAKSAYPAWDLVHFEKCEKEDEYSLFFAFKKLKWN
jgi:predicted SAM-dependent methyltransferase